MQLSDNIVEFEVFCRENYYILINKHVFKIKKYSFQIDLNENYDFRF